MYLEIVHTTRFEYATSPDFGLLQLRVRPISNALQRIEEWNVDLSGLNLQSNFQDQFGNNVDLVEITPGFSELQISVSGRVNTIDQGGVLGFHTETVPLWLYLRQTHLTRPDESISELCAPFLDREKNDVTALHDLSAQILSIVQYQAGATDVHTTATQAFAAKSGVCQDHTHILLSCARILGYPARYISGYLRMEDRTLQDASHAWAEIYIDHLGWVGFDVSNGISPDDRYICLSRGLDYRDAAPTHGIMQGVDHEKLIVSVNIQQ